MKSKVNGKSKNQRHESTHLKAYSIDFSGVGPVLQQPLHQIRHALEGSQVQRRILIPPTFPQKFVKQQFLVGGAGAAVHKLHQIQGNFLLT